MSDKKEDRHVRLTKSGKKLKKVNPLLDELHIGRFESAYKQAFGENASVAYRQGYSGYSLKLKNQLVQVLEETSDLDLSTEITQVMEKINTGDALSKDLAMVVLRPIGLAIEGSMPTLIGLVQMMSNIPAVLKKKDDSEMLLAMSRVWLGVSILLLAAVAPLARLYNAATRAYASVAYDDGFDVDSEMSDEDEFEVDSEMSDAEDLDGWFEVDSEMSDDEETGLLEQYRANQGYVVIEPTNRYKHSMSHLQDGYSSDEESDNEDDEIDSLRL